MTVKIQSCNVYCSTNTQQEIIKCFDIFFSLFKIGVPMLLAIFTRKIMPNVFVSAWENVTGHINFSTPPKNFLHLP